ncbi:organic radical activating enzyme [Actimicrobium sp. GrIS 1.19]|nr:organic radical activating enzyme [Actimicrobium sp. GrIS 1.19]
MLAIVSAVNRLMGVGMNLLERRLFISFFSCILCAACAQTPAEWDPSTSVMGNPVAVESASRVIILGPATEQVDVTGGESVAFAVGEKAFAWKFDGSPGVTRVDLMRVAPAGLLNHS